MSGYFVIVSFELHEGQLENWKELSRQIDQDIAQAEGFVSRDSGMDGDHRVYCLVKWQSKGHQEAFMQQLMARPEWEGMMAHFASIVNMETEQRRAVEIF